MQRVAKQRKSHHPFRRSRRISTTFLKSVWNILPLLALKHKPPALHQKDWKCCLVARWAPGWRRPEMAGTLPSDFKPAKCAVLKLTFGVSGTAANTDEGAEPFLASTTLISSFQELVECAVLWFWVRGFFFRIVIKISCLQFSISAKSLLCMPIFAIVALQLLICEFTGFVSEIHHPGCLLPPLLHQKSGPRAAFSFCFFYYNGRLARSVRTVCCGSGSLPFAIGPTFNRRRPRSLRPWATSCRTSSAVMKSSGRAAWL